MWKLIFLFSLSAFSQDQWICEVDSSQIQGDTVAACGVGEGEKESIARKRAFESAKAEFDSVCGVNTECGLHKYAVEPKRTTCTVLSRYWKCYRMVVFRPVSAPKREIARANIIPSQSLGTMDLGNQDLTDRLVNKMLKDALGE